MIGTETKVNEKVCLVLRAPGEGGCMDQLLCFVVRLFLLLLLLLLLLLFLLFIGFLLPFPPPTPSSLTPVTNDGGGAWEARGPSLVFFVASDAAVTFSAIPVL